jgi:hypothetical protein
MIKQKSKKIHFYLIGKEQKYQLTFADLEETLFGVSM